MITRSITGDDGTADGGAEHGTPKEWSYFTGHNDHILQLLPPPLPARARGSCFLDVGCAAGQLGRRIKELRPDAIVHGLDREPSAVAGAREHLDRVFEHDLDTGVPDLDGPYDAIICGDVLEHLIDPWAVLRGLVESLRPGGSVLTSIPNVRYYKILRRLVFHGEFTYTERGILDSTHLRFFTRREMEALLESAGLRVTARKPRLGGGNRLIKILDRVTFGRFEELRAMQYTMVGVKD